MTQYEMVAILDPGLDAAGFEAKTKALEEGIREHGGVIQKVTPWGKRRLAYDIRKKDAGWYLLIHFEGKPDGLLEFKESIRHDLEILRYLIVIREHPLAPEEAPVTPSEAKKSAAAGDERPSAAPAAAKAETAVAATEAPAGEPGDVSASTKDAEPPAAEETEPATADAEPVEESAKTGTGEDREES